MKLLLGNQTVTLVKHIKADTDTYACYRMSGASWFAKITITTSGDGAKPVNTYISRIPAECFPSGVQPAMGDYMVRGVVTAISKPSDLKGLDHFRITAVGANNRGGLAHWRVDGQ